MIVNGTQGNARGMIVRLICPGCLLLAHSGAFADIWVEDFAEAVCGIPIFREVLWKGDPVFMLWLVCEWTLRIGEDL